jgi:HD-GYP domain-containing protein (c-di-GMP phosphodiesterase class II)
LAERVDRLDYPDGLAGEAIPLASRIRLLPAHHAS